MNRLPLDKVVNIDTDSTDELLGQVVPTVRAQCASLFLELLFHHLASQQNSSHVQETPQHS